MTADVQDAIRCLYIAKKKIQQTSDFYLNVMNMTSLQTVLNNSLFTSKFAILIYKCMCLEKYLCPNITKSFGHFLSWAYIWDYM